MTTLEKMEVLKDASVDADQFGKVLNKLLEATLDQHKVRLTRYTDEMKCFEQRYGMDTADFYQQFQAGLLGDDMDYFEWAGLYELREDLLQKIQRLESAL
jgi:hypothetical protein